MDTRVQTALCLVEEASMTMLGLSPMETLIQISMYQHSGQKVLDVRIGKRIWLEAPNMGQK